MRKWGLYSPFFKKDVKRMMCSKKAIGCCWLPGLGFDLPGFWPTRVLTYPGFWPTPSFDLLRVLTYPGFWPTRVLTYPGFWPTPGFDLPRVLTQVAAGRCWALLGTAGCCWALLGTVRHICANFATCSWEPLTMLNPHFVAGEHGLFGGHKSEDIRTFFFEIRVLLL